MVIDQGAGLGGLNLEGELETLHGVLANDSNVYCSFSHRQMKIELSNVKSEHSLTKKSTTLRNHTALFYEF